MRPSRGLSISMIVMQLSTHTDEYAPEICTILRERSPRAGEVLS